MPKLSAWMKKHLSLRPSPKKRPKDALPMLPSPRRPITPESFATPACLLFQLPWDIWSMILSITLGGKTLHVDLMRQDETWKWRGIVCGQDGNASQLPSPRHPWSSPRVWNDGCLQSHHQRNPEENIGIMGFLLSCRQAYTEGIEFLYSTNSIFIESETLLLNLPGLIPTNRLAFITSLQIIISAHWIEQEDERPSLNLDHLQPILDNIATYCHSLRHFCLAFLGASDVRGSEYEIIHGSALPMLDAFYRSKRLRDMTVELPTKALKNLKVENWELMDHTCEVPAKEWHARSHWRCLDGEEPTVQYRSHERYPHPPLRWPLRNGEDDTVESDGYWFREGDEGPMRGYCVCF